VFEELQLKPIPGYKMEHPRYYESSSFCSLPFEPHWYRALGKMVEEQIGLDALAEAYCASGIEDIQAALEKQFNRDKILNLSNKYASRLDKVTQKEMEMKMENEEVDTLSLCYDFASADLHHKSESMGVQLGNLPEVSGLHAGMHQIHTSAIWYMEAHGKIDEEDMEFMNVLKDWQQAAVFTALLGKGFCVVCENPIKATKIHLGEDYPDEYDVEMEWGASSPHTAFKHKTWKDLEEEHGKDVYHTNVNQNPIHSTVLLENAFKHGWKMVFDDKDPQDFKVEDSTVWIGQRSFHIVLDNYYPNEEVFRVLLKEGERKVYLDMKHSSGSWSGNMEDFGEKEDFPFRLIRN
jgi:hypothetical protein